MALETQLQELINLLRGAVRDGSLGAGMDDLSKHMDKLSDVESDRLAQELKHKKVEAELNKSTMVMFSSASKRIGVFSKDLGLHSKLLSSSFMEALDRLDYENFELVPEALQKHLKETESFRTTIIRGNADVIKFINGVREAADTVELIDKAMAASQDERKIYEAQLKQKAKEQNTTVEKLIKGRSRLNKQVEEGIKVQEKLNDQMRGGSFGRFSDSMSRLTNPMGALSTAVAGLTHAFGEAARPAARFGTEVSDSLTAFMAGMNPEEMAQNMAEYRQSINASGLGLEGFREVTEQGSLALTGWTGELRDAVRVQASAFGMAQRFGVSSQAQMQTFMDTQVRTFKQFNEVFSMTAEEFVQMNKQLESSQSVNEQIYRLNRQQRVQHAQEIQQTVLRLRTFGLMQEQAMKVVDAMAAIGAKSPKERMKEAAKLQAVGGALGFGQAAEEMATIMRRGMRGEGDYERFAELQKEAQGVVGQRMGEGFASELMTAQMLETTGLEHLLGPKSDFATLNTEQYKAIQDIDRHAVDRNEILGKTLGALGAIDMIQAALTGPIMKALAAIAAAVGVGVGGKMLQGAAASLLGAGGGKTLLGLLARFIPMLLGGGLIIGGVVAAVSAFMGKKDEEDNRISAEVREQNQAVQRYLDKLAAGSAVARQNAMRAVGMENRGRLTGGFLGLDRDIRVAGGKTMDYSDYQKMSKGERERIDLAYLIERMEAKRNKLTVDQATDANTNHRELIAELQEQIGVLRGLEEKFQRPIENLTQTVEKQTEQQGERHREAMKKVNGRTNRLIWTPAGG